MKTSDVAKWKGKDWWNVKGLIPSGGGAVGVLFAYMKMDSTYGNKSLYSSPSAADFVIKPTQDTAASTKFAESMLKKIGGLLTPHTRPIERMSEPGSALVNVIREQMKKGDQGRRDRWQKVFPYYNTAKYFLIMETQAAITEFGDRERESGGMEEMLQDEKLMANLGRLFVADAMIGNGDRLSNLNSGNILFNSNRQMVAIDSETILQEYTAACRGAEKGLGTAFPEDYSDSGKSGRDLSPKGFVTNAIVGRNTGGMAPTAQQLTSATTPVLAPSFAMENLFDPAAWWKREFRVGIEARLLQCKIPTPSESTWEKGRQAFFDGVELGMREVDSILFGRFRISWLATKVKFRFLLGKYGGGANYDWTTFKIRRLYYKHRRAGLDDQTAIKRSVEYADKKLRHLHIV
ncbi:MAG: hypothetical protein K1X57_04545 [Gemmataceae bacterium]|nr:hypothetical protein [Gemmataceae bacterium]